MTQPGYSAEMSRQRRCQRQGPRLRRMAKFGVSSVMPPDLPVVHQRGRQLAGGARCGRHSNPALSGGDHNNCMPSS